MTDAPLPDEPILEPIYRSTKTRLPVVVIKRRRRDAHHQSHAGAWKVAYADFVTAMMSLFLLLWILSVTNPTQREAISSYFDPDNASQARNGTDGVLGGKTIIEDGAQSSTQVQVGIQPPVPGAPDTTKRRDEQNEPSDNAVGKQTQASQSVTTED